MLPCFPLKRDYGLSDQVGSVLCELKFVLSRRCGKTKARGDTISHCSQQQGGGMLSVFVRVCRACAIFSAVAKMVSPFTGLSPNQKVAAPYWLPGFIE